jgi:transcriptional regulator with XRE-family HTH domain
MTISENIAQTLRMLRARDRLSLRELSKLLGINKNRLSDIEHASAQLKVSELEKIANFFGTNVPEFLKRDFLKEGRNE